MRQTISIQTELQISLKAKYQKSDFDTRLNLCGGDMDGSFKNLALFSVFFPNRVSFDAK